MIKFENYKIKKGIPWQLLDENIVILSPEHTTAYELNDMATVIWQAIDEKMTFTEYEEVVNRGFDMQPQSLQDDTLEFLEKLTSEGLLEFNE